MNKYPVQGEAKTKLEQNPSQTIINKYKKMDPTLKQQIETLEQRGQQLQKESKYKESLDVYQQVLQLNKNAYGSQSQEYERIAIKLCQLCNLLSMILLQKQKFDLCLMFLKKGQAYCLKMPKYTAITFNNYACYYRKTGKHRTALMYLQRALDLEWKGQKQETLADTYLNLCAVLSQLSRHDKALINVLFSVTILQEELLENPTDINLERVPVLSIAYHNMGVELEHLKRPEQSISAYQVKKYPIFQKAVAFASKYLGEQHGLTQNLMNVLRNAIDSKDMVETKKNKKQTNQKEKVVKMKNTYSRPRTSDFRNREKVPHQNQHQHDF